MLKAWRLRRRWKREIHQAHNRFQRRASTAKSGEIDSILIEYDQCLKPLEKRLAYLESNSLLRKASRLGIDVPPSGDWWEYEFADGDSGSKTTHLSDKGRVRVEKLIRDEKFKNAERYLKLAAVVITALTGLVGVIIGLIAILKR